MLDVLISGHFRPDDHWHVTVSQRNRQWFPACPDCGDELQEQTPAERETGLRETSPDFGLPEVQCGCGSVFTLVSGVGLDDSMMWVLRRRYFDVITA
jgi:hypothetical protein